MALAGVGLLGVVSGLIATVGALQAPGLSDADHSRMWSNGIAEAFYDTAFGALISAPAWIVGALRLRSKARAEGPAA
jgi:biopolymer transport protein ExbB